MTNPPTSSLFPDSHLGSRSSFSFASLLDLSSATIDEQFDSGEETGVLGCQEQPAFCNFVRRCHTIRRDSRGNPCDRVRGLSVSQGRLGGTGTQEARADAAGPLVARSTPIVPADVHTGRHASTQTCGYLPAT